MLSVHYRALHRGGAAVFRQKRDMDIHTARRRVVKNIVRQYFTVCNDDYKLRAVGIKALAKGSVTERFRGEHRNIRRQSHPLYRRGGHYIPPPAGLILTCHGADHIRAGVDKSGQDAGGYIRRPHEHYSSVHCILQFHYLFFLSFTGRICTSI